jgi:hypothetical protein
MLHRLAFTGVLYAPVARYSGTFCTRFGLASIMPTALRQREFLIHRCYGVSAKAHNFRQYLQLGRLAPPRRARQSTQISDYAVEARVTVQVIDADQWKESL